MDMTLKRIWTLCYCVKKYKLIDPSPSLHSQNINFLVTYQNYMFCSAHFWDILYHSLLTISLTYLHWCSLSWNQYRYWSPHGWYFCNRHHLRLLTCPLSPHYFFSNAVIKFSWRHHRPRHHVMHSGFGSFSLHSCFFSFLFLSSRLLTSDGIGVSR